MTTLSTINVAPKELGNIRILVGVKQNIEYRDGKPTGKVIGYKYEVVLPEHAYDRLDVKINGAQQMELAPGETCSVTFDNLTVRPYVKYEPWGDGKKAVIAYTASADAIHRVEAKR